MSFSFLSAQFVVPSGINNALQIIQRVLVTTTGTSTGTVVMDTNTGANNIYINPTYLPISQAYSGQYVLTVNASGFVSLTTGSSSISGATISGGNLLLMLTNWSIINAGSVIGAQGIEWNTGAMWATGNNWTNGINWAQGIEWNTGAMWATGVGIINIISNTPTSFTINLSNGSGYTLTIPSGGGSTWPWEYGSGSPSAQIMGANNNAIWQYSLVWWANNTADVSAEYGFIGGGSGNTLSWALYNNIVWWSDNAILWFYNNIVWWWLNNISSSRSSIVGWLQNIIQNGEANFIGGWDQQLLNQTSWSAIVAGEENTIDNSVQYGVANFIGGWSYNILSEWNRTVIAGWYMNEVYDSGYGFIGAGWANSIENTFSSSIVGWSTNTVVDANFSSIVWWNNNRINWNWSSFIGGWQDNIASGHYATIPWWLWNKAYGESSFSAGRYAEALHDYSFVWNGWPSPFASTISNMFLINASNGVAINTNTRVSWSTAALTINGSINTNLPPFANDAAALVGWLVLGDMYQTNGSWAAPLNVPGIVMIKQ